MLISGKNSVAESLNSIQKVDRVVCSRSINAQLINNFKQICKKKNIDFLVMDQKEFKAKYPESHQGVVAYMQDYIYSSLEELLAQENPFLVLLDHIEDPHNLGAIIRVAECAGVSGIIIPKHRSVQVNDTVLKVSAGAASHVKICCVNNLHDAIDKIKSNNIFVYACDMSGQRMYDVNLEGNVAVIVGGEGKGVSDLSLKKADAIISIPMFGKINSLNASVSTGIVLYEIIRQKMGI